MEAPNSSPTPSRDAIAHRAHEIFLARGGEHGFDVEDWVQAEQELTNADPEAPEYAEVIPLGGETDPPEDIGDAPAHRETSEDFDSAQAAEDRGEE